MVCPLFYVPGIVLEPSGNIEDSGLDDDVPFAVRPQEYFDSRIEVGHQIRQLGAEEEEASTIPDGDY